MEQGRPLYFRPVVSSLFFLFSSPILSRRRLDGYHTSRQWRGISANLECRSEMCCTLPTENTGRKKSPKNRHLPIAQLCRAISSQLRHVSTIGKKLVKHQYRLQMFSQYGYFGPLMADIVGGFGAPQQISTGFASWLCYGVFTRCDRRDDRTV